MRPFSEVSRHALALPYHDAVCHFDGKYRRRSTRCLFSFEVFRDGRRYRLACGKCLWCRQHRVSDWLSRMKCEAFDSKCTFFVTLTYDDSHKEPINRRCLQLLFKRLRKDGCEFRYVATAEYGPRTVRPHYHVLMFIKNKEWTPKQFDEYLRTFWTCGLTQTKSPSDNHLRYIAGYDKKSYLDTPTFKLYSLRPGIGYRGPMFLFVVDYYNNTGFTEFDTPAGKFYISPSLRRRAYRMLYGEDPPPSYDIYQFPVEPVYSLYDDHLYYRQLCEQYNYELRLSYEKFIGRKL